MKDITKILEELHYQIGDNLLKLLESGQADSKDISNAIKYLKDNNFILDKQSNQDPILALKDIIDVDIKKPKELPNIKNEEDIDDIINNITKK